MGSELKDTIFREYDIRGIVNTELLIEQIYDLTCSIVHYMKEKKPNLKNIVVGMDGRTHSPAIKKEVCRALIDSGLNVLFFGVCPSPALYFALYTMDVDAGLMITASHNPKEYNGIKICLGTDSLWGEQIQEIKDRYKKGLRINSTEKGIIEDFDILTPYVEWLKDHFKDLIAYQLPLVIDCGNGATGAVIPRLVREMQWENAQLLCCDVDGTYPNHEADPTVEQNMKDVKRVLASSDAQLGIGFDGDGDRMSAMTKKGYLIPGDQLLALFAQSTLIGNPGAGVVFDVKASSGLIELLEQWGAKPIMSPCGHAIVKETLKEKKALLGGELSCHFFFKDRHFGFDDAIYAALRLIELIKNVKKPLDDLLAIFPKKYSSHEYRIPCSEEKKDFIVAKIKDALSRKKGITLITIDGVRASMPDGWGLIRPSNTQPVLSLRFEANSPEKLKEIKTYFVDMLFPYIGNDAKVLLTD